MRLKLVWLSEAEHHLVWTWHHIILDAWSVPIILGEFFALYEAHAEGRAVELEAPRPFKEFIAWQRTLDLSRSGRSGAGAWRGSTSRPPSVSTARPRARRWAGPTRDTGWSSSRCRPRRSTPCGLPAGRWRT